jgi:hypothetical protein
MYTIKMNGHKFLEKQSTINQITSKSCTWMATAMAMAMAMWLWEGFSWCGCCLRSVQMAADGNGN